MNRTRVLICGGRDWLVLPALALLEEHIVPRVAAVTGQPIGLVIHGGAKGADAAAHKWALRHSIPVRVFPADWLADGKSAGPIRNRRMIAEGQPDIVVALAGGKGTADMIRQANAASIPVVTLP